MWFKNRPPAARPTVCRRGERNKLAFRLNLFRVFKDRRAAFNPLDAIDAHSPEFLGQCRDLAHMLVAGSGEEREPYRDDMAEEIALTGLIAFVCACEPDRSKRTLDTVHRLVSSRSAFTKSIEVMKQTPGFHGVVARLGEYLQWLADHDFRLGVIARAASYVSPTGKDTARHG